MALIFTSFVESFAFTPVTDPFDLSFASDSDEDVPINMRIETPGVVARKTVKNAKHGRGKQFSAVEKPTMVDDEEKPAKLTNSDVDKMGITVHERYLYYVQHYGVDYERAGNLSPGERRVEEALFHVTAPLACMVVVVAKNVNHDNYIFSTGKSSGIFLKEMKKIHSDFLPTLGDAKSTLMLEFIDFMDMLYAGDEWKTKRGNARGILTEFLMYIFALVRSPEEYAKLVPFSLPPVVSKKNSKSRKRKAVKDEEDEDEDEIEEVYYEASPVFQRPPPIEIPVVHRAPEHAQFRNDVIRYLGKDVWNTLRKIGFVDPYTLVDAFNAGMTPSTLDNETLCEAVDMARLVILGL
jgi:hypothetical protein